MNTFAGHPPTIPKPIHIPYIERTTAVGDTARWIAFVVLLVSSIAFFGLGYRTSKKNRAFHYISAFIALIATLDYYALATGYGVTYIFQGLKIVQGREVAAFRQVAYARYVDAILTTPMLLFELGLVAGLSWIDIGTILVANEGWIITLFFASLTRRGAAMWGWFTFSSLFLVWLLFNLLYVGRKSSRLQADHVPKLYLSLTLINGLVWAWYSIGFAVGNGTDILNYDVEVIVYVILDIIAKACIGFFLIFAHGHGHDDHAGTIPDHLIEPRSSHRIRLPGGDD